MLAEPPRGFAMKRFAWLACVLALAFGLVAVTTSQGAPITEKKSGEAAPGQAAHGKSAEKKDMFGFENFLDLAIWTWVVFLLLFLVLARFAWKPILEGLKKREQNIAHAQEEAEKAQRETRELQAKLQAKMDAASQQIATMMEEARRDAQHTAEEMRAEARKDIQAERERLHHELQVARDQALQELWTQTAQLATLVSSKALGRQMTEADHTRLIDESLQEFYKSGTEQYRQVASVRKI
jgi:F-type H+-transporting ATPase subunit b